MKSKPLPFENDRYKPLIQGNTTEAFVYAIKGFTRNGQEWA